MDNKIHDYDYRPIFDFFKTGKEEVNEEKLLVGFELEIEKSVDATVSKSTLAEKISELMNNDNRQFIYYKNDGSLSNGLEVVSMPFSFDYIMENKEKIKKMLQYMQESGYESHDPRNMWITFSYK